MKITLDEKQIVIICREAIKERFDLKIGGAQFVFNIDNKEIGLHFECFEKPEGDASDE